MKIFSSPNLSSPPQRKNNVFTKGLAHWVRDNMYVRTSIIPREDPWLKRCMEANKLTRYKCQWCCSSIPINATSPRASRLTEGPGAKCGLRLASNQIPSRGRHNTCFCKAKREWFNLRCAFEGDARRPLAAARASKTPEEDFIHDKIQPAGNVGDPPYKGIAQEPANGTLTLTCQVGKNWKYSRLINNPLN